MGAHADGAHAAGQARLAESGDAQGGRLAGGEAHGVLLGDATAHQHLGEIGEGGHGRARGDLLVRVDPLGGQTAGEGGAQLGVLELEPRLLERRRGGQPGAFGLALGEADALELGLADALARPQLAGPLQFAAGLGGRGLGRKQAGLGLGEGGGVGALVQAHDQLARG
jgi:hypothetical protein